MFQGGAPATAEARPAGPWHATKARVSPDMPGAGDNGPGNGDGAGRKPPKAAEALASKPIRSLPSGSTLQDGGRSRAGAAPTRLLN